MPVTMDFYPRGWPLDLRVCPCDAEFVEYLDEQNIRGKAIFHFGTGEHHHVGIECSKRNNAVFGITASVQEIDAYTRLAIADPEIVGHYTAFFGDIYMLDKRLLPNFDVVFLPHLSEFVPTPERRVLYGQMGDGELLDLLTSVSKPGALFVFYRGSRRYSAAKPSIREWMAKHFAQEAGEYKTLRICRLP